MSNDSSNTAIAKKGESFSSLPWGPGAGLLVTLLAFVIPQLLVGLLVMWVLLAAGWDVHRIDDWLGSIPGGFVSVLCSEVLALVLVWLFLRHRKANWRLVGYMRNPAWKDLLYAVVAFVIYFALLLLAGAMAQIFLHINTDQKQELGFDNPAGTTQRLLAFISLVIIPPIAEETLFRGFMFGGLRKKLSFVWATLIVSVCFAAPHLLESSSGPLWIAGLDTFIMSIVLCYVREKTGALWAGIGLHMLKNGLAFLLLYIFVSS